MKHSPYELSSWPQLLWMSFRGTVGALFGVAGLFLGLASWFIPASANVSVATYVITIIFLSLLIFVFFEAARISRSNSANRLPRVRFSVAEENAETKYILLMLEPSLLFSHGLLVSVFILEQDQYERFFASGVVQNVQDDGLVQIRIQSIEDGFDGLSEELRQSRVQTLARLRVKPYVQQRFYNDQYVIRS